MKSIGMKARTAPSALVGQRNTIQISAAPASGMSSSISVGTKINEEAAIRRTSNALLVRKADANGFSSDWPFNDTPAGTGGLCAYLSIDPLLETSDDPINFAAHSIIPDHAYWTCKRIR